MDAKNILGSDYIDIIFEGRNKSYGGYELRRNYSRRVFKSLLLIACAGVFPAAYSAIGMNSGPKGRAIVNTKPDTLVFIQPVCPVKPLPSPPVPPAPLPPSKPAMTFTPPKIEDDMKVTDKDMPPAQKTITAPGPKTEPGDPRGIDPGIVPRKDSGSGVVVLHLEPAIFNYVEQMPVPSGDLHEYLAKNTRYPALAQEGSIHGRVTVRFVVNEDGSVSDAKVAEGIGGGCDEEAQRVVLNMPKWKPGRQNGKAVKVYFTLPIIFTLE